VNAFQIVLLICGIIIFVVSFLIPEKKSQDKERKEEEKKFKKMVEEQVSQAKFQLEEHAEETVSDAMAKAERSLERISNEKIMAVNEYSHTVLEDINKNHEEAVFLYSMLDDKHTTLKDTVISAEKSTKEVRAAVNEVNHAKESVMTVKEAFDAVERAKEESRRIMERSNALNMVEDASEEEVAASEELERILSEYAGESSKANEDGQNAEDTSSLKNKEKKSTRKNAEKKEPGIKSKRETDKMAIPSVQGSNSKSNNNEKILKLHREGKSNVAIAKELGLGVGEVKLVIDLFRQG